MSDVLPQYTRVRNISDVPTCTHTYLALCVCVCVWVCPCVTSRKLQGGNVTLTKEGSFFLVSSVLRADFVCVTIPSAHTHTHCTNRAISPRKCRTSTTPQHREIDLITKAKKKVDDTPLRPPSMSPPSPSMMLCALSPHAQLLQMIYRCASDESLLSAAECLNKQREKHTHTHKAGEIE